MATVLDLRASESVGRGQAAELTGHVIVLDDADALVRHAEIYLALVGGVDKVICIAIGEADQANWFDGVALTVPPALRDEAVLWVGQARGLDWAWQGAAPRPSRRPTDSLDELITTLHVDKVFDWVWQATRDMPGQAASPGILLAFGPVEPTALSDAAAAAIRELCTSKQAPSRTLSEAAIRLDAEHDPQRAVFSGPLDKAAKEARKRLERVARLVHDLGAWHGPARAAAALSTEISRAGQAAENYRRYVAELLDRMDGHLQGGRPSAEDVMELGVPEPIPARGAEVAAGLRTLVGERLDAGVSLPSLAEELRITAAFAEPQGVGASLNRLRRLDPLHLDMPAFARWSVPLVMLPVILLTCLAMVFLPGPGTAGPILGAALAVLWFGTGWQLLAAQPEKSGRRGFGGSVASAAGAYGLTAALGVVVGAVLVEYLPGSVRVPYPLQLFVAFAVLAVGLSGACWRAAFRRWRAALALGTVTDAVAELERMAAHALLTEWLPMRRRRLIATGAAAAAIEVEAMRETFGEVGDGLFTAHRAQVNRPHPGLTAQPVPQELLAVVGGDLVRLCHATLDPLWPAVEAGRPPEIGDHDRLKHLLVEYDADMTDNGLMWMPEGADSAPRVTMLERVWAAVPTTRRTMRIVPSDEMRQLCDSRQLGYLSGSARPSLVRFAPLQLRRVLDHHPADRSIVDDPGIEWTDGSELIGALRLVPLRAESIRRGWGEF